MVAGPDAPRRPVDVLALVHRRHLRRLRRAGASSTNPPPTTGWAARSSTQIASGAMKLPFWMVYDDTRRRDPAGEVDERVAGRDRALPRRRAVAHRGHPGRSRGGDRRSTRRSRRRRSRASTSWWPTAPIPTSVVATRPTTAPSPAARHPWCRSTRPPYHAAAFGLSDLGTKGGLRTDRDARVLDAAGPTDTGALRRGQHDGRGQRHHVSRRRQPDRRVHVVQPPRRARTWPIATTA